MRSSCRSKARNHLILQTEPAWQQVVRAVEDFLPAAVAPPPLHGNLTARENEVLELLAQGLDNDSIARKLGTSTKTVRNQVSIDLAGSGVNPAAPRRWCSRATPASAGKPPLSPACYDDYSRSEKIMETHLEQSSNSNWMWWRLLLLAQRVDF